MHGIKLSSLFSLAFVLVVALTADATEEEVAEDPQYASVLKDYCRWDVYLNAWRCGGADLTGVDLTGEDISGNELLGVRGRLKGCPDSPILDIMDREWKCIDNYLIGPGAGLDGADLTGFDLTGMDLITTDFKAVSGKLAGCPTPSEFKDANNALFKCINKYLIGPFANVTNYDFTDVNINGADLTGVTGLLAGCPNSPILDLHGQEWKCMNNYLIGPSARFSDYVLRPHVGVVDLTGVDLTGINLHGVIGKLKGCPTPSEFLDSNGQEWKCINKYLVGPGAVLEYADLAGLDLTGVDLTGAFVKRANLTGADLTGAYLTGVSASAIECPRKFIECPTENVPSEHLCPDVFNDANGNRWTCTAGHLIGPGALLINEELLRVVLSGNILEGLDLTGVTFTEPYLYKIKGKLAACPNSPFTANDGQTWHCIRGFLIGPGADLTGSSLSGAGAIGIDLTGVDLSGVDLTSMTLTGAKGQLAECPTKSEFRDSNNILWKCINKYLVGPGANLERANFFRNDLSFMDLTNAILTGADLGTANLEGANLAGANLTGADLTTANLKRANLQDADLTGANFASAVITNANLAGARLFGVTGIDINSNLANTNVGPCPYGKLYRSSTDTCVVDKEALVNIEELGQVLGERYNDGYRKGVESVDVNSMLSYASCDDLQNAFSQKMQSGTCQCE